MNQKVNRANIKTYQEANLSQDELSDLAEEIRCILMGDKGLTLPDYIDAAKKLNHTKLGYRKLKALLNEPTLEIFFPEEVYNIIKDKGTLLKQFAFNDSDDAYLRKHGDKGIGWLSKRFYADPRVLYKRAKHIKVQINKSLHHFNSVEDNFIKNNFSKGSRWIANALSLSIHSVRKRANRIGVKHKRGIKNEHPNYHS